MSLKLKADIKRLMNLGSLRDFCLKEPKLSGSSNKSFIKIKQMEKLMETLENDDATLDVMISSKYSSPYKDQLIELRGKCTQLASVLRLWTRVQNQMLASLTGLCNSNISKSQF